MTRSLSASSSPEELVSSASELDRFQAQCSRVTYSATWLPASRKLSEESRQALARHVGGEIKSFKGQKSLFNNEMDCLKQYHEAAAAFNRIRSRWLINVGRRDVDGRAAIEPAAYVVLTSQIAAFEDDFNSARQRVMEARSCLLDNLDNIRDDARRRLAREYRDEYYTRETILRISISDPDYSSFAVDTRLPSSVYVRQIASMERTISATIEAGVSRIVNDFTEYLERACSQMSNRRRLNPTTASQLTRLRNAEVVQTMQHEDDPTRIPAGHVLLQVRSSQGRGRQSQSVTEWIGPFTSEFVATELRIHTTDEHRIMRGDVFGDIRERIADFETLKQTLGQHGAHLEPIISRIANTVSRLSNDAEENRRDLRANPDMAASIASMLSDAASDLREAQAQTQASMRRVVRVRRRLVSAAPSGD